MCNINYFLGAGTGAGSLFGASALTSSHLSSIGLLTSLPSILQIFSFFSTGATPFPIVVPDGKTLLQMARVNNRERRILVFIISAPLFRYRDQCRSLVYKIEYKVDRRLPHHLYMKVLKVQHGPSLKFPVLSCSFSFLK